MSTCLFIQLTKKETEEIVAGSNDNKPDVPKIDLGATEDRYGGLKKHMVEEIKIDSTGVPDVRANWLIFYRRI